MQPPGSRGALEQLYEPIGMPCSEWAQQPSQERLWAGSGAKAGAEVC